MVDIFPAGDEAAYRLEFFGDKLERVTQINPLTGEIEKTRQIAIFPGSHYITPHEKLYRRWTRSAPRPTGAWPE